MFTIIQNTNATKSHQSPLRRKDQEINFLASNFPGHMKSIRKIKVKAHPDWEATFLYKSVKGEKNKQKTANHVLLQFFQKAVKLLSFADVSQV